MIISFLSVLLIYIKKVAAGILLSQLVLLFFPIVFCLFFDVGTLDHPRVSHLFLPAGAILGYLNYRRNPNYIQLFLIIFSVLAFIFFSGSSFVLDNAVPLSDNIRSHGGWIATCVATLMIGISIYSMQLDIQADNTVVSNLRLALFKDEFELFFQPQLNSYEKVIGAEALLRWHHPVLGYIPPNDFIPMAEVAGLMPKIGEWVLKQACKVLKDWSKNELTKELTLSVNISSDHFMQHDFEKKVIHLLKKNGIRPSQLMLEITESIALNNIESVVEKMNFLYYNGVHISLDDFGTGYSSLSYLQKMPVNQIKLDRSFIQVALNDNRSLILVNGIIKISLDMNIRVLAEGIETSEQFYFFKNSGCAEFQGFFWGRPIPLKVFMENYIK